MRRNFRKTWTILGLVVAEAIQTILRREAYPHPYEALKALTRTNKHMTEETIHEFIKGLNVSDSVKAELMAITPSNYTRNLIINLINIELTRFTNPACEAIFKIKRNGFRNRKQRLRIKQLRRKVPVRAVITQQVVIREIITVMVVHNDLVSIRSALIAATEAAVMVVSVLRASAQACKVQMVNIRSVVAISHVVVMAVHRVVITTIVVVTSLAHRVAIVHASTIMMRRVVTSHVSKVVTSHVSRGGYQSRQQGGYNNNRGGGYGRQQGGYTTAIVVVATVVSRVATTTIVVVAMVVSKVATTTTVVATVVHKVAIVSALQDTIQMLSIA